METTDPTRYYFEDVQESIEGKYSDRQLKQVLSEFGYNESKLDNGLDDEGFRKLQDRLAEVDSSEARLKPVKKKDLSLRVVERPVKVKAEKKKSDGYLSVVGRDIWKVGKGIASLISCPFMIATTFRKDEDDFLGPLSAISSILAFPTYYLLEFTEGNPQRGLIVLGVHLGSNLISGIYEYARHVKNRPRELGQTHS